MTLKDHGHEVRMIVHSKSAGNPTEDQTILDTVRVPYYPFFNRLWNNKDHATFVRAAEKITASGVDAYIVPPKDPEAFAGACMELLYSGFEKRALLGRETRKRVETHFELSKTINRYEELYQSTRLEQLKTAACSVKGRVL